MQLSNESLFPNRDLHEVILPFQSPSILPKEYSSILEINSSSVKRDVSEYGFESFAKKVPSKTITPMSLPKFFTASRLSVVATIAPVALTAFFKPCTQKILSIA